MPISSTSSRCSSRALTKTIEQWTERNSAKEKLEQIQGADDKTMPTLAVNAEKSLFDYCLAYLFNSKRLTEYTQRMTLLAVREESRR